MQAANNNSIELSIRGEFSSTPGPRYKIEGDFSGEVFRKNHLLPKFTQAIEMGVTLVVHLDGTAGYGTSFLEEAFGGLIREDGHSLTELRATLEVISNEEPYLLDDINDYMLEAAERVIND